MCSSCPRFLLQAVIKNSPARFSYSSQTALPSQQDTRQDIINGKGGVHFPHSGLWSIESSLLQSVWGSHCNMICCFCGFNSIFSAYSLWQSGFNGLLRCAMCHKSEFCFLKKMLYEIMLISLDEICTINWCKFRIFVCFEFRIDLDWR